VEKISESKLSPVTPEVSMYPGGTGTLPSGVPSDGEKKHQPGEKTGADKKSETPVKSEKTGLSEKNEVPMELSDTRAGAPAAEAAGSGTGDSSDGVNQSLKVTRQGSSPSAMHPALSPQKEDLALRREIESQLRRYIEKYKRYPDAARRRGLAGEVELRLTIKTGSRVELSGARLVRSAGSLLLDREARSLVESFFPYHSDIRGVDAVPGSVLTTSVRIRYEFR
jgi:protein TonB